MCDFLGDVCLQILTNHNGRGWPITSPGGPTVFGQSEVEDASPLTNRRLRMVRARWAGLARQTRGGGGGEGVQVCGRTVG